MEKEQDQRVRVARSKACTERKRVYVGNGTAETENNSKSH